MREHALAKEMEERSRRKSLSHKSETPFGVQKGRFTQFKSRREQNGTNQSHSLAYAEAKGGQAKSRQEAEPDATRQGSKRPAAVAAKPLRFTEAEEARCKMNEFVSNKQANWMWDKHLCVTCGKPFHGMKSGRAVPCPKAGQDVDIKFLKDLGLPPNKF